MIVITGAAGFIGSVLAARLNEEGYNNLVLVDDFDARPDKQPNWTALNYRQLLGREQLFDYIEANANEVEFIFHIGAKTDTTLQDKEVFDRLNVAYSKRLWQACVAHQIPIVYASSAATYGNGEHGYADDEAAIPALHPMNPYGWSKQDFDLFVLEQTEHPPFYAGLKFFNVYGPNEYHKGRMASVIFHAFNQIKTAGSLRLFRSHNPAYADGGQMRDFVYVKDLVSICHHLLETRRGSGIYNLGSGTARTFNDLARATFRAMGLPEQITYIDTPIDIRDTYQYYTQADMTKMAATGYRQPMTSLEDGVADYVTNYLIPGRGYALTSPAAASPRG